MVEFLLKAGKNREIQEYAELLVARAQENFTFEIGRNSTKKRSNRCSDWVNLLLNHTDWVWIQLTFLPGVRKWESDLTWGSPSLLIYKTKVLISPPKGFYQEQM